MVIQSRPPMVLSAGERDQLAQWAAQAGRHRLAVRAAIVLSAADGGTDAAIAARTGVARATAAKWRGRFAADRLGCPRDDIVTKLVNAELDGGELTSDEFGFFVILLAVAGNETTRNAISHGMLAFLDHPDQWELYRAERPQTAVDEIVRWATPVTVFQRTALADTMLGGQQIKAGQRVGLFYRSANFDEDVFDAPERFDITRDPNPHLGFDRA